MSEPSIGAVASSAPPPMSEEPTSMSCSEDQTLVCACVNPSSEGAEGASEPGARALVERFGGSQGAGGVGEVPEEPRMPGDGPSCSDEALRAIGACGAAAVLATGTGGLGAVFAGMVCAGALDGYVECLNNERRAAKE